MSGPGAGQFNQLSPPVGFKGGSKQRSCRSRSKKGGGLFQLAQTAWDNATIGVKNLVNGYNGTSQLQSASPWIQPELIKPPNIPFAKPIKLTDFIIPKPVANV
jgi:hypothetical protein